MGGRGGLWGLMLNVFLFQLSRERQIVSTRASTFKVRQGEFSLITRAYFHYTVFIKISLFLLCKMKMCADSEHFEKVIKREHGVLPLVQGVSI